jgi:putative ubiquitin-RnfH superfamily antitoxin RatB of RatAB toxin-antitoxin module
VAAFDEGDLIEVEVAYAKPAEQVLVKVRGHRGMTLGQAIERANIAERFPEISLTEAKVGVFGKVASKDAVLNDGDRVEIYRPLIADPKEARKQRAAQGKSMKESTGVSAGDGD